MQTDYDAIIIGAGLSGIAAGIRLAHYGQRVLILERHALPGGLNSYYPHNGEWFDVGLHAMTNYVAGSRDRRAPFNRLLRQLRIRHEELDMVPQRHSKITFPGRELSFTNDFDDMRSEVARLFPDQVEGFDGLAEAVRNTDSLALDAEPRSAREVVGGFLGDSVLADMLFCPLMFYGNADEHDMEFNQFCIMFQSVFLEGFWRPRSGMRPFIGNLLKRYEQCGGEIRLRCGVRSLEEQSGDGLLVTPDKGAVLTARRVLSCAGYLETLALLRPVPSTAASHPEGKLGYVESIFTLDCPPAELGFEDTITFFCEQDRFVYGRPDDAVDFRSGVLCVPGNFLEGESCTGNRQLRMTHLANPHVWAEFDAEAYAARKRETVERQRASLEAQAPGFGKHILDVDMFTPCTVKKFTGHRNGSIYGSPLKHRDGRTPGRNVFVCGTDQGFLGIVGSMLSGVSMANLHLLIN